MLALMITGAALVVGWVIFFALRASRHARKERLDTARDLGFVAAEAPELLARLTALYARPGEGRNAARYELRNVFRKHGTDAELFIYDLVDASGDDRSRTETQAVAVVSPRLCLPPFVVLPRVGRGSKFGGVANRMITWVAKNHGRVVDTSHAPEFAQHYVVTSPDPDGARRFLTASRLHAFGGIPYASVFAGGDAFTFSQFHFGRSPGRRKVSERVGHASRIFSAFRT